MTAVAAELSVSNSLLNGSLQGRRLDCGRGSSSRNTACLQLQPLITATKQLNYGSGHRKATEISVLSNNSRHCWSLSRFEHAWAEKAVKRKYCPAARAEPEKGRGLMTEKERTEVDTDEEGGPPTTAILAITTVVLVLGTAAYLIPGGPTEWVKWGEEQIESAGPLAPVYYAFAYCLCTIAFIPASILTLAAGYIFGPFQGTAVVSVSSTLGASLAFLISRYAARPLVESRLANNDRFVTVDKAISREGWKVVALLRLSPLFPFALSNYALGLTRIDFVPYVAASWVGMLPATFAYVYLGSAGKATVDAVTTGGGLGTTSPLQFGLYAVGALATIGVTTLVSRIASKALSEAEGKEDE